MLAKIVTFFMKELSEKAGRISILALLMLVPDYGFRIFFMLL